MTKYIFRTSWAACLAFLAAANCVAVESPSRPSQTNDLVLYEIGYAHLDTQWRWSYPQTIHQFLLNTMWDNFSLFDKYPHYIFNFTGANRYRMMKEYWPPGYQRVRQWAARGRWFPAGSSWEENDVLVPSPESLLRQILYGQRFFERELGRESNEYMLPDCFGFPASLPSILAHCGLRGFSTQKLTWGSAVGIPFNVGVWEGPDGGSVIAVLNAGAYDSPINEDLASSAQWRQRLLNNGAQSGLYADFQYYGVGDTGGAPGEESVQWLEKNIASTGAVRVISARADQMFRDITDEQKARLPKYKGDLLLTQHSAGSLTSEAYMKRWNRKNEVLAEAAEKAAVAAHLLGATPYPREKLHHAWELVLGAQFHDILPGTSLPRCYEYSWNDEIIALNCFASVLQDAVGGVARALDTQGEGIPLVVFNPLSIAREDVVEAELELPSGWNGASAFDPAGNPVPTQEVSADGTKHRLLFLAKVPSIGFAVYSLKSKPPAGTADPEAVGAVATLQTGERRLENARYRVALNEVGDIASIFDKSANRELLAAPARLALLDERPKDYPAWNMDWKDRRNPPRGYVEGAPKFRRVENGPVRVAIEIERRCEDSLFIQTIRLAAGSAGDRVEVANRVDWLGKACSLKAEFPLTVSNSLATYNWELGKVQRGNNNSKKYEVPSHQWFDLSSPEGDYGVSVLTDTKYGSDKPNDNTLRLTLLYTPGVGTYYSEQQYQDWGRHEFIYALSGHRGDWRAGQCDWQAARLGQPLLAFRTAPHPGKLGRAFGLLECSSDQIAVRTVKLAEDNDKVIVRLQELDGLPIANVQLKAAAGLGAAAEVNGLERNPKSLKLAERELALDFKPYQLRSLACRLRLPAKLTPPVCQQVKLPYNLDVFSFNELKQDGACDDDGATIPAEMIGDALVSEGIAFQIGPRENGKLNAVACRGQKIPLPQGDFNRLYLLALAVNGDTEGVFTVDNQAVTLRIEDWSGHIGRWDDRVFQGPVPAISYSIQNPLDHLEAGFIKRDPLAWFCSHRHARDGTDETYLYCYLFKYALDLPRGAKALTLPASPHIRVLAITAASNENDATTPVQPLYDDLTGRTPVKIPPGR